VEIELYMYNRYLGFEEVRLYEYHHHKKRIHLHVFDIGIKRLLWLAGYQYTEISDTAGMKVNQIKIDSFEDYKKINAIMKKCYPNLKYAIYKKEQWKTDYIFRDQLLEQDFLDEIKEMFNED